MDSSSLSTMKNADTSRNVSAVDASTPFPKSSSKVGANDSRDASFLAETSRIRSTYPLGTILNAIVTNVHNLTQLSFFMFVKNEANTRHFANVRYATTPPNGYKCLRVPREGLVFALRVDASTVLRAVRLPTLSITSTNEVYFPDIGRSHLLLNMGHEMYHLPLKLRSPPAVAVVCQLRGVNDDVTILPRNMRAFLRGLLFRNVKLRVDGYNGSILKVQLLEVTLTELDKWTSELGKEELDFYYALKYQVSLIPNIKQRNSRSAATLVKKRTFSSLISGQISLSDEEEESSNDEMPRDSSGVSTPSTPSSLPRSVSSDSWFSALELSAGQRKQSPILPSVSRSLVLIHSKMNEEELSPKRNDADEEGKTAFWNFLERHFGLRPILGRHGKRVLPIRGTVTVHQAALFWKHKVLPVISLIDKRQLKLNILREELLTITPTFIGQLERFFGVVHRRGECYLQHMWNDEEVPKSSRFLGTRRPYVFDIVLAKHGGDFKWYRAKVIEITRVHRKVLVFYVDYGGLEYVDAFNLATLAKSISQLPFQAVLFRLYNLVDNTSSEVELAYGVELLRTAILKKTLTVRVTSNKRNEVTICLEDNRFCHIAPTLMRKGLLRQLPVP